MAKTIWKFEYLKMKKQNVRAYHEYDSMRKYLRR